jgi:hypothetical protein
MTRAPSSYGSFRGRRDAAAFARAHSAGSTDQARDPVDLAGRITPDAALAVSLEPPGGSPTGLPTGPVIAAGKLTNL